MTSETTATDKHRLVPMFESGVDGPSMKAVITLRDVARMHELTPERIEVLAKLIERGPTTVVPSEHSHAY